MSTPQAIYVDNSILSTGVCAEKQRLSYVEHYKPIIEPPPLVFGSAFHAGVAGLYEAKHFKYENPLNHAIGAFWKTVKERPGSLPVSADSTEKRSVERGVYLLTAYAQKWERQDLQWEEVTYVDKETGEVKLYIEIGFAIYFMDWHEVPVFYVGKIDRIKRYRVDGMHYVWETKTSGTGLAYYMQQVRPNHQLTGYVWATKLILPSVAGIILDAIYVSDRKIDGKFPNGVDIEKDFSRVETRRSERDIDEFLYDLQEATERFLSLRDSGKRRWHRAAPTICYMYGGCHFRDACNSNLNPQILSNKYRVEKWEPWKGIDAETKIKIISPGRTL